MLLPPLLYWKAANSSIMPYCTCTAYWMFHDAMPNINDAPLMVIFRMWQQASHSLFSQQHRLIHLLWTNMTMPPIDCWICITYNRWHSVDAHINHIESAFAHSIIVCNQLYTHFWHPVLRLYVLLFAFRSFVTCQFLINCCLRYLSEKWHGLLHSRPFGRQLTACRSFH